MKFYDLGGGENIRSIWDKYYHDAHGLLYVVDGADGARWGQSKGLFAAATSHKYLEGKVRGRGRVGPTKEGTMYVVLSKRVFYLVTELCI